MGGSVFNTYREFVSEGPLAERTEVVIEPGKSLRKIAKQLYRAGIISSPAVFEIGARAGGYATQIKSGEYSIPERSSAKTILTILTSGNTYIRRLVVPEGLTSHQIVKLMNGMYGLVGDVKHEPKNGTLMPDTYYYSYGDTKENLLERMHNGMNRAIEELWKDRDKSVPLKSPEEAIIMASMVEKETAKSAERPHIASVFFNRLAKKMKLQSDPTVIFGLSHGTGEFSRALTYKDLRVENGYNTYVIPGLPKGPISNPGYAALKAVLHPDKTEDLYFVADGKGGHTFAKTYAEHEKNVAKYRAARRTSAKVKTDSESDVSDIKNE
ncbi:MAG: endolytic transglycosylase MltG [Alphaproteobacteria bacterium]|nr:endolytic transglycosylase MltG [Alphaproteobacteria bacterium]